jgi:hypothetical protein
MSPNRALLACIGSLRLRRNPISSSSTPHRPVHETGSRSRCPGNREQPTDGAVDVQRWPSHEMAGLPQSRRQLRRHHSESRPISRHAEAAVRLGLRGRRRGRDHRSGCQRAGRRAASDGRRLANFLAGMQWYRGYAWIDTRSRAGSGYCLNPLCKSHAASGGPCSSGRIGG